VAAERVERVAMIPGGRLGFDIHAWQSDR